MSDKTKPKDPGAFTQLLMMVLIMPLEGWTIKLMWDWFIVPLGATPITIWHALGIHTIVNYFTYSMQKEKMDSGFWYKLHYVVIITLLYLLTAFIIRLFM